MTDDPCDDVPEPISRYLWGSTLLERADGPIQRAVIKHAMRGQYGSLGRPIALDNDPCDPMPWAIRWEAALDPRTRMHAAEFGKLLSSEFNGADMPSTSPAWRLPKLRRI
jgi:hypothetical protein